MKLTKEKNNWFGIVLSCFTFFLLIAAAPKPSFKTNNLNGTWCYTAIYKHGKNILKRSEQDSMVLDLKKHNFNYRIVSLNKDLFGRVKLISVPSDSSPYRKALAFSYNTGNQVRVFHIMNLADSLVIREGNTYFHYLKK